MSTDTCICVLSLASPSCADRYAWNAAGFVRVFHWFQALLQQDCRLHASWWWWWWTALHWWWHCYPPRAESAGVGFTCLKLFDVVVGGFCLMESGSVGGGLKIRIRCLFFCQHLDFCRSLYTNILHSRIKARRCMCQRYRSYICVLYCAAIDAVRQAEAGSTSPLVAFASHSLRLECGLG